MIKPNGDGGQADGNGCPVELNRPWRHSHQSISVASDLIGRLRCRVRG